MSSLKSLSFSKLLIQRVLKELIETAPSDLKRFLAFYFFLQRSQKATCLNFPHYIALSPQCQHLFSKNTAFFGGIFTIYYIYYSLLLFWRALILRTIHITSRIIAKIITKSNHKGQTITVFSTIDSSPKIFTICFALKMPIDGILQV